MDLVHNNYIRPLGHGGLFTVEIDERSDSAQTTNYFEASKEAAQIVADSRVGEINLMYSGGVDSEYTLALFRHLGIAITPVIVRLLPDYNAHDIAYAFKYCEQHGIKPKIIDIDFDHFVSSGEMFQTAVAMRSSKFHYAATAHAIGKLSGTVLCGDGEPYIRINQDTNKWNLIVHEYEYALSNYYRLNNIHGTPHFNRYTRDMFYEFLTDDRMWELGRNQVPGKISNYSSKWITYNRHSEFNLAERTKYHGYENIETRDIFKDESFNLLEKLAGPQWDGAWSYDYLTFIAQGGI